MDMDKIVLIVCAVLGVLALYGFLRGYMKGLYRSIFDVIFTVISAVVSVFLAKFLSLLFATPDTVTNIFGESSQIGTVITEMKTLGGPALEMLTTLPIIIVAPLVYIPIFIFVWLVLKIPKVILQRVLFGDNLASKKGYRGGNRFFGGAVGLLCMAIMGVIIIIPVLGYANLANNALNTVASADDYTERADVTVDSGMSENIIYYSDVAEQINGNYIEPIVSNPVMKGIYDFGGKSVFETLSSKRVEGIKVSLSKEINAIADFYSNASPLAVTTPQNYNEYHISKIEKTEEVVDNSEMLPCIISGVLSYVGNKWSNNEQIFGYDKIYVGEDYQYIVDNTLNIFASSTEETAKKDYKTFAEVAKHCIENEVLKYDFSDDKELNLDGVLKPIYDNERTRPLLAVISDLTTKFIYKVYDEANGTNTPLPEKFNIETLTSESMDNEEEYFEIAVNRMVKFLYQMDSTETNADRFFATTDIASLGASFDALKRSLILGDASKFFISAMMKSEQFEYFTFLTDELIEDIVADDTSAENIFVARQKLLVISLSVSGKKSEEDYNEAIKAFIKDTTPETAESIKSTITTQVLQSSGMSHETAESMTEVFNTVVDVISERDLENVSEEEMEKDAQAVNSIVSAVKDISKQREEGVNVFSTETEEGSVNADKVVEDIMNSPLAKDVVKSSVTGDSETKIEDPYKIASKLTESDKNEVENALLNYYNDNTSEDEAKDADLAESLDAIASIFGLTFSVIS